MNFLNSSENENDYINYSYHYFEENEYFNPTKHINDERFFPNENEGSPIYDGHNLINEREEKYNNDIHPFIQENIFDEKYKKIFFPPYIKKNSSDSNGNSIENKITSGSSKIISKKTKRIKDDKAKNMGRKKKDGQEKGEHTKFTEDNIIRKIKSNFIDYSHNLINNSFKNKELQFLRFDSEINENLKKDYNLELMDRTFKDLYENTPISKKYKKISIENGDLNKNIINKIYYEEPVKEFDVINLLNMTYKELFNDFIINNLDKFLSDIYEEEKNKNESEENILYYIEKVKQLCYSYENWYLKKKGRNRQK